MYSFYFHIPFCEKKCNYCSFYIIPTENKDFSSMKDKYLESMKKELLQKKEKIKNNEIYSIYFWWGTPSELGLERVVDLLNFIKKHFDLSKCVEVSFELNPNPLKQTLEFIDTLPNILDNFRFSIWVQSVENNILQKSGRNYNFQLIEDLMKNISKNKNFRLNLDFISFGIEQDFSSFDKFLNKNQDKIDSLSIYTLELFPWSVWGSEYKTDEDKILDNFEKYTNIVKKYWYERYEISNFAKKWKESKHNQIYWEMKEYIGIWSSASWFIRDLKINEDLGNENNDKLWIINDEWKGKRNMKIEENTWNKDNQISSDLSEQIYQNLSLDNWISHSELVSGPKKLEVDPGSSPGWQTINPKWQQSCHPAIRYTNSYWIQNYIKWKFEYKEYKKLTEQEFLEEQIFLGLRTDKGIKLTNDIKKLLDFRKINEFIKLWYLREKNNFLYFTNKWFNLYNYIITEILELK